MTKIRRILGLALTLGGPSGLWGLEGEVGVTLTRTQLAVVAGPPGTAPQETGVDRARLETVVGHKQTLGAGWSIEALGRGGADTLPSGNPQILPAEKLDPSVTLLEGWLGWEPLPGALALGVGKRRVQPSSGFSIKPLDELARTEDREGRTGVQVAWFGDQLSASVFAGPAWPQDGTDEGFVLGRVGVTLGSVDVKAQGLQWAGVPRFGAGLDGSWGDHLTFRTEATAEATPTPREHALAGLTWTADDLSTLMVETGWDARTSEARAVGFLRGTTKLDEAWEAQAWMKAEVAPATGATLGGWSGVGLSWKAPRWTAEATAMGAWGPAGTSAGNSALRWKTEVTTKVFLP